MGRAPTPRAVISSPTNPIHNGLIVSSDSPHSDGDQRLGTTSTVPDYGLAYNPAGSYEDVAGFSMDDGVEPASPTLVSEEQNYHQKAMNVELSQADRQEGYDTNLLELQPRGVEHNALASANVRPESSSRCDGDPFATPPPPFVSSGASFRSSSTGTPPHSPNATYSIADPARIAASSYERRARDSVQARKRGSRGQSMAPSEKPLAVGTKVQKWHKIRTIAIVMIVVIIVALAVGLGAGLGTRSHKSTSAAVSIDLSSSTAPSTNTPIADISTPSISSWTPTYTTDWATYTDEPSASITDPSAAAPTDLSTSSWTDSDITGVSDTWTTPSDTESTLGYWETYSDTSSVSQDTATPSIANFDAGGGGGGGGFKRGRRQHFRN